MFWFWLGVIPNLGQLDPKMLRSRNWRLPRRRCLGACEKMFLVRMVETLAKPSESDPGLGWPPDFWENEDHPQ